MVAVCLVGERPARQIRSLLNSWRELKGVIAYFGDALQEDTIADSIDALNFMYSAIWVSLHAYLVAWNDIPIFYTLLGRNGLDVGIL